MITGARGFLGRNLAARLRTRADLAVHECSRETNPAELADMLAVSDAVFHLAGVNRPHAAVEFDSGNTGFTEHLIQLLRDAGRAPLIVFSSSIQATQDNAYGRSKRAAEDALRRFAAETGAHVAIFRLRNVFGKWSRPDYNSVVATFCHNIARDLPIVISDPAHEVDLVYVDDVIDAFLRVADGVGRSGSDHIMEDGIATSRITLGDLAARVSSFREIQRTLMVPDFSSRFNQQLYATYLSFVVAKDWAYDLQRKRDNRGDLVEFIKSEFFGQIFVSRTLPGFSRGHHYHNTKTEKFLVVAGEGLIRIRHIERNEVIEFVVRGEDYRTVDIPPGCTHSITNIGYSEMITLFWASEIFDPLRPDTTSVSVDDTGTGGHR